jgi:hypothetical protein
MLNDLSKQLLGGNVDRQKPIVVGSDGNRLTFAN